MTQGAGRVADATGNWVDGIAQVGRGLIFVSPGSIVQSAPGFS
jgi:hypothetical protein